MARITRTYAGRSASVQQRGDADSDEGATVAVGPTIAELQPITASARFSRSSFERSRIVKKN
jgi:hypothetical protein